MRQGRAGARSGGGGGTANGHRALFCGSEPLANQTQLHCQQGTYHVPDRHAPHKTTAASQHVCPSPCRDIRFRARPEGCFARPHVPLLPLPICLTLGLGLSVHVSARSTNALCNVAGARTTQGVVVHYARHHTLLPQCHRAMERAFFVAELQLCVRALTNVGGDGGRSRRQGRQGGLVG